MHKYISSSSTAGIFHNKFFVGFSINFTVKKKLPQQAYSPPHASHKEALFLHRIVAYCMLL